MVHSSELEILVATRNRGKVREIQEALSSLPVKLRYLEEFENVSTVDEVGRTYEENAVLKALEYSKQTGVWALADDSGLEVDAAGRIARRVLGAFWWRALFGSSARRKTANGAFRQ